MDKLQELKDQGFTAEQVKSSRDSWTGDQGLLPTNFPTDEEIDSTWTTADSNFYTESNKGSDANQKAIRRVNDGVNRYARGESLEDLDEASESSSVESQDAVKVEKYKEEKKSVWTGLIDQLAKENRYDLIPSAVAGSQEEKLTEDTELTPFVANIYKSEGAERLTVSQINKLAVQDFYLDGLSKALDAQSSFENGVDILNMMALPDVSYNASQISDYGNWFTSYEGMVAMASQAHKLPEAERKEFYKELIARSSSVESSLTQQYTQALEIMGRDPNSAEFHALDKLVIFDVLSVGAAIARGITSLNPLRKASQMGNNELASTLSKIVTGDPKISNGIGVPETDAAMAGNPLKAEIQDTVLNGTTVSPSEKIRMYEPDVDKYLKTIDDIHGADYAPTLEEKAAASSKWREHMESQDEVSDAIVRQTSSEQFTVTYKMGDGHVKEDVPYTLNDYGGFETKEFGLGKTFTRYLWSPLMLFKGADRALLSNAPVFGTFQKAKASKNYEKALNAAVKPIKGNSESFNKINSVMQDLNGVKFETSHHNMVDVGIGGVTLTDKEFKAYQGVRRIFDHMHEVNNTTIRKEMTLRDLSHTKVAGEDYYVNSYKTSGDASKGYNFDVGNNQTMMSDGSLLDRITPEIIEEQYALGNRLVKVGSEDKYGWFKSGSDNHSRYAFVANEDLGAIPPRVLPYTENYVPRSREEAHFFIRKKGNLTVNGNSVANSRAIAWANTETQANEWLAKFAKTDEGFNSDMYEVVGNREIRKAGEDEGNTMIRMNGGMYRGSRSSSMLIYAGDNTEGKLISPMDSLQRAMNYTSDRMTMSRMRIAMKHRWYQDATLADHSLSAVPWNEAKGAIADSNMPPQRKSMLLAQHDQISAISGIPTKSEQAFSGALKAIGKGFDKKGYEGPAKWFYNKSATSDPTNALKGGAFHMMLGMYNPAQFLVQAMGAAVTMAANPVSFTKAVPKIMAAQLTDLISDTKVFKKSLEALKKKGIVTEKVEEDLKFWRESGLREAVLRGSADFNNAGNYTPADAGMVRRVMNTLAAGSTKPYEAGDLANIRIAFFTALEHERALVKGKLGYNKANLQKVVARTEQYRLGMSSANKASFQKGIMALPTQFKSIYTKFLESMMGDWFTPTEKFRIFGAQIAMFGAAGVPIANTFQDFIVDMFAPEDADAETLRQLRTGAIGWLVNDYWDLDAVVAGRVAIAGDIGKEIHTMLFSDQPFIKSFMGASFTTTDKAVDVVKNMWMAGHLVWDDEQMTSVTKMGMFAKTAALSLATIPTSSRRVLEAYYLGALGEVRTSSGRTLYKEMEDNIQLRDVIVRGLGFASEDSSEIYETSISLANRKKKIRGIADSVANVTNMMLVAVEESDEANAESAQMVLSFLMNSVRNDGDRQEIEQAIATAYENRDFKNKTINDWLKQYYSELLNAKGKVFVAGEKHYEEVVK